VLRRTLWATALAFFAAGLVIAQRIDSSELLAKILARVHANGRSLSRYICRQRIVRRSWVPQHSSGKGCIANPVGGTAPQGAKLATLDRVSLDVIVTRETEMFSWPGASHFEARDPGEVLRYGGLSEKGDFGAFLSAIFGQSGVKFHYDGPAAGGLVRFSYEVPQAVSGFEMRGARGVGIVGYEGSFDADPRTGDLVRVEVQTMGAPSGSGLCGAWEQIRYLHQQGESKLLVPEQTATAMFSADGHYAENQTSYEACRQYGVEATLKFDDDATPVAVPAKDMPPPSPPPPGTEFIIRLATAIDSESAWAGDRIEGTLAAPAIDPATHKVVAPAGSLFRGRVTQIEHDYEPARDVIVGLTFNAIVLNGVDVPVTLVRAEPGATGVWAFRGRKKAVLAKGFESRWRVRTKEDEFLIAPVR